MTQPTTSSARTTMSQNGTVGCREARASRRAFTPCVYAARAALMAYDYPGNVRQLEHVVQRAVAVAHGPLLEPADLPEELFASRAIDPHSAAADGSVAAARERAEREMIVTTLARNNGEVSATARELQVSRTTLWRLMKKHQI
jgi:two-component system NtrC family response regulator